MANADSYVASWSARGRSALVEQGKKHLKRIYFWIGERSIFAVWLLNLWRFEILAIRKLRSRYKDQRLTYSAEANHLGSQPGAADHNDHGLNFYARLLLQYRYDFIIELGAFSLERSRWLAKHLPVRVHGLDVTADFRERRSIEGVQVGPNNLQQIADIALQGGRGLVVSHGTLCYYPTPELAKLLLLLAKLGLDLAFSEPNTSGELSLDRSLRRTHKSYYHPYVTMLKTAGFRLPDNNGHQIRDCWGEYAETRTFIYAISSATRT